MFKTQNAITAEKSFSGEESQLYKGIIANRYKVWYSPKIWHYVIN